MKIFYLLVLVFAIPVAQVPDEVEESVDTETPQPAIATQAQPISAPAAVVPAQAQPVGAAAVVVPSQAPVAAPVPSQQVPSSEGNGQKKKKRRGGLRGFFRRVLNKASQLARKASVIIEKHSGMITTSFPQFQQPLGVVQKVITKIANSQQNQVPPQPAGV